MGSKALGPLDGAYRLDQPGLDPSAIEGYGALLRELAGVVRVSGIEFFEILEQLRLAGRGSKPTAVEIPPSIGDGEAQTARLGESAGRPRQPGVKGAASKDFLLY